jgi:Protein of unknown function (DUF2612)
MIGLYVDSGYWVPGYAEEDLVNFYLTLITSEHRIRPRFMQVVDALTISMVEDQALLDTLPLLHNIDRATGVQLDHLGEWIGFPRYVPISLPSIYFSWDVFGLGWDEAAWQGRFDASNGVARLTDDAYRTFLRAKIAANVWDGTLPGAYAVLALAFGADNHIVLSDNQDMSMTVTFTGHAFSDSLVLLLTSGLLPLKPSAVRINFYGVSVDDAKIFAWDSDGPRLGGWGSSWAREIYPPPPPVVARDFTWDGLARLGWSRGKWAVGI